MKKRILCLLLVLLQAGMVACGNAEGGSDSGETKSADMQTETAVESETEEADPFAGFNYDGKDFRIYTSTNIAAVSLGNSNYMIEGPEELTGDAAPDAAYERNLAVEDLLNVHFTYEHLDNRYDQVNATIKKYITAGEDAYDLIINDMYGLSPLTLEGMFYNILDGKYFDFSKPWWYDDFMSDVAINSNYQYMLGGDYFIDILRCSHCLFYNKSLYEKMTGDGEGLYDVVLAGDWTFDAFNTLVEQSYVDLNGDGKKDTGDQFGYAAFETWGPMIPFLISADPGYIARRADGYPEITINNEKGVYLLDQLYRLMCVSDGCITSGLSEEQVVNMFTEGRSLFIGYQRLGSLENATIREMEDGLGVVPYPKLDENQKNYVTSTRDTAEIGVIPVTVAPTELDYISAVLEVLCRETYKNVLPVYYESSLKMKYTRDDTSAKMIDIVHDNIGNSFALAYNTSLNEILTGGIYNTDNIAAKKNDFASAYAKREKVALQKLDKIIENFEAMKAEQQ